MKRYKIGNFTVMPLSVEHNVQCLAYVIDHPDIGRLIFATDCIDFPYKVQNVNYMLCEVNYCEDKIIDNICNGADIHSRPDNHMSLDTAIEVVGRLYNPRLSLVCAIHLSDGNSDENAIKKRFREELGIDIKIADKNTEFILSKEDF